MAELVIKGGLVVDGSGGPPRQADVAVTDGRIEAVGPDLQGSRYLDASGQVVAPGFIDLHTHYDAQVLWDPGLTPSSWHGVTSVVAGNCGFSLAPCRPDHHELVMRTLERVEDMPYASLVQRHRLGLRDLWPVPGHRRPNTGRPSTSAATSATPRFAST